MITTRDDGMVWTHDEAAGALRGECDRLGARVVVERVPEQGERFRRYVVTLDRWGARPLSVGSTYGCPCPASNLLGHVRTMVLGAVAAEAKEQRR